MMFDGDVYKKRTRADRSADYIRSRRKLYDLANSTGHYKLAGRLNRCRSTLRIRSCGDHVETVGADYECCIRLCPTCGRKRSGKLIAKYGPAAAAFPAVSNTQAVHLVLTQVDRPGETAKESVTRLMVSWRKLQRRRFWEEHFKGALWVIDPQVQPNGSYHTHMHLVAFRRKVFNVETLRALWLEITGDSVNFFIERIQPTANGGIAGAMREAVKYAVKPQSIDNWTKRHFREFVAMKGTHLVGVVGEFAKFAREYQPPPDEQEFIDVPLNKALQPPCLHCGRPQSVYTLQGIDEPALLEYLDTKAQGEPLPAFVIPLPPQIE